MALRPASLANHATSATCSTCSVAMPEGGARPYSKAWSWAWLVYASLMAQEGRGVTGKPRVGVVALEGSVSESVD